MPRVGLRALERLAERIGEAMGRSYFEAALRAEQENAPIVPPTKVESALAKIGGLLRPWAQEAARTPRAVDSYQAKLLQAVKDWMQAQAEQPEDERDGG